MKENNVLTPEIYASYPYDGKILEYYQGVFESVYIILHPFYRGITLNLDQENDEFWFDNDQLRNGCKIVLWKDVIALTKFENYSQIHTAWNKLNSGEGNGIECSCISELAGLYEKTKIAIPDDSCGIISPFLSDAMLKSVKLLGYSKLWLVDEFSYQQPSLHDIDELLLTQQTHNCNYTEDHKLLFATHWDSHFSFLCSSKSNIDKILENYPFEGFFCTPKTEVYWGLHEI